jgi:NodT family efflux transporter outer membrane factor (OMF) lipoprotein
MRCKETRTLSLLLIGLFALALPGCATKKPPARTKIQSDALSKIALTEPWKARGAVEGAVPDDWLASFGDDQLTALVTEAVANNPDLRITAVRVEQAAQYVKLAKAKLYPTVGIAGRFTTKLGADLGTGLSGVILGASWEIDLWGRVRYGRNAAREDYTAVLADQEYARQSIAAATANAWFLATETLRLRELAEEMVKSHEQLVLIAEKRSTVGVGDIQDVSEARVDLTTYRDYALKYQSAHEESIRALELLLGRYPGAELSARPDLPRVPSAVPAGIPLEVLERRPDLIAAERRIAAAFNRKHEARAARLPQISLTGNTGAITSETIQLKPSFSNPIGGLVASILAPIFDGGALKTKAKIASLEQEAAVAEYAKAALRAIGDVENALSASQILAERERLLLEALQEDEKSLALQQVSFRVGKIDRRPVLRQEVGLYDLRAELIRVQAERLIQRVNLNLALGVRYAP